MSPGIDAQGAAQWQAGPAHVPTRRLAFKRPYALLQEIAAWLSGSPRCRLRQMTHLHELDDRMLRDIGLTRWDLVRGQSPSGNPEAYSRSDTG